MPEPILCSLCPRGCGAPRWETRGDGYCGMGTLPTVARAAPHFGEEPCVTGTGGSGAVFFGGCTLGCVFCQNGKLSKERFGIPVTPSELRDIFLRLIDKGVENVNLVTPTHYTDAIIEALRGGLPVPVVWNCGGYEKPETLRRLEGLVQVYMPDLKYLDAGLAARYSGAPDYPEAAKAAIEEMYRQTGPYRLDDRGVLQSGLLIRHLVLPGELDNSFDVMDYVASRFPKGEVLFSLMSQFTPQGGSDRFPNLGRGLTEEEHRRVTEYLGACGILAGFWQDRAAAGEDAIPAFDGTGVKAETAEE